MNAIYKFFGVILSFFSDITGGYYLFGLFLFALLVKIILLPLSIKQQKTSIKQAKMRPKEMAIRKKYKGRTDKVTQQKMQNEIMELYQRENYNPMSGCLPLLIQMPVIIILYNVIINPLKHICGWTAEQISAIGSYLSVEESVLKTLSARDISLVEYMTPDKHAAINDALTAAGLEAVDFSVIPNFMIGAFDLSAQPAFWNWLLLVPVFTFVFQFIASKIQRKFTFQPGIGQEQQTKSTMMVMDIMLPAMTTLIAFRVPAAIGIYWMFNNILGVVQTILLHKAMPLPTCTEDDIKAAERELAGKAPKNVQADASRGPVRSLHSIDFSDEEIEADLGEYVSVYDKEVKEETNDTDGKPVSESKRKLFGKTEMKDDE